MTAARPSFYITPVPPAPMSGPTAAAPSRLNADSRRALALHAGGDLVGAEAADAQALADGCPDCRGHLASVRGGLSALGNCDAGDADSGLWPAVRASLPAVTPAAPPAKARWYAPAMALTAAAVLVGAFAFGPTDTALPRVWDAAVPAKPVNETEPAPAPSFKTFPPRRSAPALRDEYGRVIVPAPRR